MYETIQMEKDRVISRMKDSEFPPKVKKVLVDRLRKIDFPRIYCENKYKGYPEDYVQDTIIKLLKKKAEKVLATMDHVEVDELLCDVVYGALPS